MEQPKNVFAFVHYGPQLKPEIMMGYPLNVKKIKGIRHSDGLNYTIVHTSEPKRTAQVMQVISKYNETCCIQEERLILSCLPSEPSVISFTKSSKPKDHVIGKMIDQSERLKQSGQFSTFWSWNVDVEGRQCWDDDGCYDVVKKQTEIAEINHSVGYDMTEVLLGSAEAASYFHMFSEQVMGALEAVNAAEAEILREERVWMTADARCISAQRIGFVYGAWNPFLGDCIVKIGATMRTSPLPRLKELSRTLPVDFQLICVMPSSTPFVLEKRVHEHFAAQRVWRESTGRTTEFFMVSKEEVDAYFTSVLQAGGA
jgi:hypothetical protein